MAGRAHQTGIRFRDPAKMRARNVHRWQVITAVVAAGVAVLASPPASAGTLARVSNAGSVWGKAEEVPGTAALNAGNDDEILSVSCGSAGNCSAGGFYASKYPGPTRSFVVSQVNGAWGKAMQVPGTATLNKGGAEVESVSCASAGNCTAAGDYTDSSNEHQAFVVSQVNGTWGKATQIPGTATLNKGGNAQITSVSCASAGNCTAAGDYTDSSNEQQAFVVSQADGLWRNAAEVSGTAALNKGGMAQVASVSCASAGNCTAVGYYTDSSGNQQTFAVSQTHAVWGTAVEPPGVTLNLLGSQIDSVSCASAAYCAAGGVAYGAGNSQAFLVSQVNGSWEKAVEVPGTITLNQGKHAYVSSVSCVSAGNCSAGGAYADKSGDEQAFVVSQEHNTWGQAEEIPGTAALNQGGKASNVWVSCATVSQCGAGGGYADSSGHYEVFVVSRT
jgi:hypothetical protein